MYFPSTIRSNDGFEADNVLTGSADAGTHVSVHSPLLELSRATLRRHRPEVGTFTVDEQDLVERLFSLPFRVTVRMSPGRLHWMLTDGALFSTGLVNSLGGQCAGALSVRPPGTAGTAAGRLELTPARIEALSVERSRLAALWGEGGARLSLAGAQDKLPVVVEGGRLFLPLGAAASTHLLKFGNSELRHLPVNEAFTTRLAAAGGLPTVHVDLLRFGRATVALVARYDRVLEGAGSVLRLHQEDLCQALGLPPSRKYEREGGPSLVACIRLVSENAADPLGDTEALLRWQVFNALVGNADGHGKNLSVIHGRRGTVRLAPFYDLVATAIYPRLDRHLAMAVGGEDDPGRLRGAHWRTLAKEAGVGEAFLLELVARLGDDVCRALPEVAATFEAESGPSPAVERVRAVLLRNSRRLLTQLRRLCERQPVGAATPACMRSLGLLEFPRRSRKRVCSMPDCRIFGLLALCLAASAALAAGAPPAPRPTFFAPQISPDGSSVLWESLERGGSVWLTPASGGEPTFVIDGHSPSWDGSRAVRFVVSRDDGHQILDTALWRLDLTDGAVSILARDAGNPDYAPPASVSATPSAPPTAAAPLAGKVLCVDPGHGQETGAPCAATGVREDNYVLESSYVVKDWLQAAGAAVKLTRVDGTTCPDLPARVNFSNACGAKAFVAVHYNSAVNPLARGLEVFHRDGDGTSRDVARAVHDAMRAATALPTRGVKADKASLGFYLGALSTAHNTNLKTLTEGLFLSNAEDAARIAVPRFTEEVSWGIDAGLSRSLGVEPSPLPTSPPTTVTLGTLTPGAGPWMGSVPATEAMTTPAGAGTVAVLSSADRPLTTLRAGGSEWADYRVVGVARRLDGESAFGLVARCNQVAEEYDRLVGWVLLVDEAARRASLVLCAGRVEDGLVAAQAALPAPAGAWRRLALECRGDAVTASVDGTELTATPLPPAARAVAPRTGRAGAWLRGGRVALDHLAVEPVTPSAVR